MWHNFAEQHLHLLQIPGMEIHSCSHFLRCQRSEEVHGRADVHRQTTTDGQIHTYGCFRFTGSLIKVQVFGRSMDYVRNPDADMERTWDLLSVTVLTTALSCCLRCGNFALWCKYNQIETWGQWLFRVLLVKRGRRIDFLFLCRDGSHR